MIEIALCPDNNYAMPAGVMIHSVCKFTSNVHFNVIVPQDFSEENRRNLQQIVVPSGGRIDFVTIPDNLTDGFPVFQANQPQHISIAAYYRLFLGRLLPDSIEKVLYLDCDILCMKSLQELWDTDIDDAPLAAVSEILYEWQRNADRLGYDESLGYFNSGVLLVNLRYWREHNVIEDFASFILANSANLVYHDQDTLNFIFKGQVIFLPPKYNAIDMLFHEDFNDFPFPDDIVSEARFTPVIVHYTYKNKPWILGGSHTYRAAWLSELAQTPWAGIRLKPKKATDLKGRLVNLLVVLGLYKYHDDYIRK